jgi:hypothetical protein
MHIYLTSCNRLRALALYKLPITSTMPIFVPSTGAEAWKDFLADPKHWQTGRPAKSLAYCWTEAEAVGRGPAIRLGLRVHTRRIPYAAER